MLTFTKIRFRLPALVGEGLDAGDLEIGLRAEPESDAGSRSPAYHGCFTVLGISGGNRWLTVDRFVLYNFNIQGYLAGLSSVGRHKKSL